MPKTPDQLLSEFAAHVENVTGNPCPAFESAPDTPSTAFETMYQAIVTIEEQQMDQRASLRRKIEAMRTRDYPSSPRQYA